MVTNEEWCFLEIGIPTFNRHNKLKRLLLILEQETQLVSADIKIRITVSDNHSVDATELMLQQHPFRSKIVVRINPENVGALRNIWGLCETAAANYVWIIGDDDMPKPGSLKRIVDDLMFYKPTVLTFEFEQPPGAAPKRYGEKAGIEELTNLREAIPHILTLGKLTKQVINACQLQEALRNVFFSRDTGYGWLLAILEVIRLASVPKIVIDHDFLAGCDEDFMELTDGLTPQFWDDYLLLLDHELVRVNCPEYAQHYRYSHPTYMVKTLYGVLAGTIKSSDKKLFREKSRRLPFYPSYFRNPFVFFQWTSLRLGIVAFPIVWRMSEYPGRIKRSLFAGFRKLAV